ncbi:MAG TPA: hypothetical protein VFT70_16535 [Nocardioides sp.]|nr:hypothetical protein [Nocardioides sp.]
MSGHLPARTLALVAAAALVAGVSASATAPSAAAPDAPAPSCPVATDLTTLARGAPVHGLTVSQGTTPEGFTGELIGIQHDGIVPGVDLVIVSLDSPAITDAGGVWQGMSGSPVYAADDTLVGAVSWSLSYGGSDIVGVTPAAEMQTMLDAGTSAAARSVPTRLTLSPAMRHAVVANGSTSAAARAGMEAMTLPMAISGLTSHRIDQLTRRAGPDGVHPYSAPAVPIEPSPTAIVPGGNLAASIAYGSLSAAAVGTATEVCGDEVLAFGHPIMDIPRGDLTLHGADALYVQPDPLGQPYKLANITGPVGSLPDNLLPGLHGYLGPAPPATEVDSTSRLAGGGRATGTTYISLRPFAPMYVAFSAISVEDRALGVNMNAWYGAPGTDLVTWTVHGERADGTPFTATRTDHYASATDIGYTWPWELHDQLNQLMNNETEDVTVTRVTTTSRTNPVYRHLRISGLEARVAGDWRPVRTHRPLQLVAGTTQRLRVVMRSAALGTRYQWLTLDIPADAVGRYGDLVVSGGDDVYAEAPSGATVDRMLAFFARMPRNDQVLTRLSFSGLHPAADRFVQHATVGGEVDVQIQAVD